MKCLLVVMGLAVLQNTHIDTEFGLPWASFSFSHISKEHTSDRLGELGMSSPEKGRLLGNLRAPSSERGSGRAGKGLWTRASSDRTRANGFN